jgi:hydroxyacylglutathione hydrolase/adenylyltransferase/sulfurtransferase
MGAFADPEHELSPEHVAELLDGGQIELIDVREPYEWDAGRIRGARHIELERLAEHAGELPRDRPIVFQCRIGARSGMATQAFRAAGWNAFNPTGGIQAWHDAGLPLEPDGGEVAAH